MPAPTPEAIRWRVVELSRSYKMEARQIAQLLGIVPKTVENVLKRFRATGLVASRERLATSRRLLSEADVKYIEQLIETYPTYHLDELCWCFERDMEKKFSLPTMWRALQGLGMSNRKINVCAKEQDPVKQAAYVMEVAQFQYQQLVFLDEMHVDQKSLNRTRGWSKRGRPLVNRGFYLKGIKYSCIAAMSLNGMLTYQTVQGGYARERFLHFLETFLFPLMNPWPGADSVLVMDNASFHHVAEVQQACDARGIRIVFLPPYSPAYNPIENAFAKVKKFIRRHGNAFRNAGVDDHTLIYNAFQSVTPNDAQGWYHHCGYHM